MAEELIVTALAGEQKLFNFLKRALHAQNNEIHRWIRTGQVRINKKRAKAFDIVHEGDMVRVPPFAMSQNDSGQNIDNQKQQCQEQSTTKQQTTQFPFPVIYENEHILVIDKPYGIACQGGTGQEKNIADILKEQYAHADFIPAPAHRLDKDTCGLLLVGKSYQGLRFLTESMKGDEENLQKIIQSKPKKIYRTLVYGDIRDFARQNPYLCHYLYHDEEARKERVYESHPVKNIEEIRKILDTKGLVQKTPYNVKAHFALSTLKVLEVTNEKSSHLPQFLLSLVEIGIYTGRKHQIRVQLAHSGFPLAGDKKYCSKSLRKNSDRFFLQSCQIALPENPFTEQCIFDLSD